MFINPVQAEEPATSATPLTLDEHGFVGTLFVPEGHASSIAIMVLGGSEGGTPAQRGRAVAESGYPTVALAYFDEPGLPSHLDMVPLEPARDAIRWLREYVLGDEGRVVLIGGSKGAELALLLGSLDPAVGGVVAYAPSHVVFQGIPEDFWPPRSSWAYEGQPVPFVPFVPFVPYKYGPHFNPFAEEPEFLALYRESLTQDPFVEQAAIKVENINGPVLLFSGRRDRMWPATDMANQIIERLKAHEHPHLHEHHAYEEAGHIIHEHAGEWSTRFGGTVEANRQAGEDARQRTLNVFSALANSHPTNSGEHDEPGH